MTFPFVLAWRSVRIYLLPMLYVYAGRVLGFLARSVFHGFECFLCYKFVDKSFPPELAMHNEDRAYDWVRLSDLRSPDGEPLCLFRDGLEPDDINQGSLGDCWMMAAVSALARNPAAIRRLFVNTEINDRGKYQIRLYNQINEKKHGRRSGKRITVTVDDFIPVFKGTKTPMYARISDRGEIWVLLLEKAFAKIWSHEYDMKEKGYDAISGDCAGKAMYHMTGDTCWYWSGEHVNKSRLFQAMEMYCRRGGIIACFAGDAAKCGIVGPHLYSVLGVYRAGTVLGLGLNQGTRLVKIRNPWGHGGEWKGPWGDGTKEWDENSHIAKEVGYVPGDDGTFFMHIDDFCDVFRSRDFCDRTTKDDLVLEYNEKPRHLGPLLGCLSGCAAFWFLCRGARTIYLGNATSEEPPDVEAAEQCCVRVIPDCVLPDHIRYVAAEQHARRNNRA